jgi:three-Cys-motif partner protein
MIIFETARTSGLGFATAVVHFVAPAADARIVLKGLENVAEQEPLGSDGLIARDSGIWAKEKLYYLERCLDIFSVGMKKQWTGKLYYVDLFAGPGKCCIRDTKEEMDGSPLLALRFDFAKYFFFESDPRCYEALDARVKARAPEKDVKVIPGDCNLEVRQIEPPASSLGVAFIDPTGVSPLGFDTLRILTRGRRIDLILNFHEGMGIRMNIHQHTRKEGGSLDSFIGSGRWRQKLKNAAPSIDEVCREIINEFQENLRELGYQTIDRDHIPVRTDQNSLLYYLVFASKHRRGNEFWRKITLINAYGQRRLKF